MVQTVAVKYAQFCTAKYRTIKGLNISMSVGPVYHPVYLERTTKCTNAYRLDDLLRGCLYAPAHVANSYWKILNEHYHQIRPKPNYKQLSAMVYGIMWSSAAYELCQFSGYTPPLPADWRDFRREDMADGAYDCYAIHAPDMWTLWGHIREFMMLKNEAFTTTEQRIIRRFAIVPLLSQIGDMSVPFLDEVMSGLSANLTCSRPRMPLKKCSPTQTKRPRHKAARSMVQAHKTKAPILNTELVNTVTEKYEQFCKAKNKTLKQMNVHVRPGRMVHPATLTRETQRSGIYHLDDMLRGCLYAPIHVASGYWDILDRCYDKIKPPPTDKQNAAMFFGVMWSGFAAELLEYSGINPPLPFGWHDYQRKDMSFDEFDANYELEPWSLFLDIKRIIMCRIDTLTPMQQRLRQRVLLNLVLYQVISLDVERLSEYVAELLEHMDLFENLVTHIDIEHMPSKWYKSKKHLDVVERTRAILAEYAQYSGADPVPE
ncbi:MAG: hypothetical protein ACYC1M_02160 [Armatimonadota bacterium]